MKHGKRNSLGRRDFLGALGAGAGTDWPIAVEKSMQERLHTALTACGLDETRQQMVAGANTLGLLGIPR